MTSDVVNARVTFRKSPIHMLERFTFPDLDSAYQSFLKHSGLQECVILQTCNRVELFGCASNTDLEKIKKTWASVAGLEENTFKENLEISCGTDAYTHLLKLTSGLDSLVIGEEQILGQVKDSITTARELKASGDNLNTLFDKAIKIGTRVRNATGISKGSISVGSMAVNLAEQNVDDLKSKRILLIGTGEAASLVAKSLKKRDIEFLVTSRTFERSKAFAETAGGKPLQFEQAISDFKSIDVLFVATVAPYFLVTHDRVKEAMQSRKDGMLIMDLSNPRTVDDKVSTIPKITVMNMDQIAEMVEKNMKNRMGVVSAAENIINEEIPIVEAAMKRLEVEPIVTNVFKDIDQVRVKELKKALQMLGEKDEQKIRIIDQLTQAIVEDIMSIPMNNLRKASEQGDSEILKTVTKLFDYKSRE
ncbi:Glutamyl-tRNA reductase [Nitrosotalea sinensis]|jgi:glutamyl-tRNA reductase|uniref:Glutamyl-tRNA reductase n=1 Tax=Nitrosotalea sinensis TaxID=1499975 RepID=A0A2H1EJ41_9ARCH|nr:glutamyl-tRNA reductase [Candidatus Nitrosotalea sinensis]SHO48049.1 Glutamyl-tRNA reductase [Candidatus Nitrosotalea sinensis]